MSLRRLPLWLNIFQNPVWRNFLLRHNFRQNFFVLDKVWKGLNHCQVLLSPFWLLWWQVHIDRNELYRDRNCFRWRSRHQQKTLLEGKGFNHWFLLQSEIFLKGLILCCVHIYVSKFLTLFWLLICCLISILTI